MLAIVILDDNYMPVRQVDVVEKLPKKTFYLSKLSYAKRHNTNTNHIGIHDMN